MKTWIFPRLYLGIPTLVNNVSDSDFRVMTRRLLPYRAGTTTTHAKIIPAGPALGLTAARPAGGLFPDHWHDGLQYKTPLAATLIPRFCSIVSMASFIAQNVTP
mmetsp:Transcript_40974/g.96355  ORF Transcript_40974/g.96355 Transcript_40974/m.96355 type:complete len:104 (-) Transcript_40974:1612-1923(-)